MALNPENQQLKSSLSKVIKPRDTLGRLLAGAWRCPLCAETLEEAGDTYQCTSCRTIFPSVESIPVLANTPQGATRSLSEAEVSSLLQKMDIHGWEPGLRGELLGLPGQKGKAVVAEFLHEYGVMSTLLAVSPDDTSILCLGCAAGSAPFALAPRFARVTVCDLSLGRLRILVKRSHEEEYGNLNFVCSGDTQYLPFPTAEFDFLLLDAREIPLSRLAEPSFWREVDRLLKPSGHCFITANNRRMWLDMFGNRRGSGRSRSCTPAFLRKMLSGVGLSCFQVFALLPDTQSPHSLFDLASKKPIPYIRASYTLRERLKSSCLDNEFFVPAFGLVARKPSVGSRTRSADSRRPFIQGILSSVQRTLRDTTTSDVRFGSWRMQARHGRINMIANLNGSTHRSLFIKIPYKPEAERGDERNAETLQLIHSNRAIPNKLKRLIPRHLASGTFGGQTYFVEDTVNRIDGDTVNKGRLAWLKIPGVLWHKPSSPVEVECGEAMLMLHQATARVVTLNETDLSSLQQSLVSVRLLTEKAGQHQIWDLIKQVFERELLGQQLPLVWSHGDAGMCNMVLNRDRKLCGIIDWETFDRNGLPLCDWIVLCISTKLDENYHSDWTWLKWALIGNEHKFFGDLPIENYLRALQLDRKLIPVLALASWVQYAAHRLPYSGRSAEWVGRTVHQVLELCKKVF